MGLPATRGWRQAEPLRDAIVRPVVPRHARLGGHANLLPRSRHFRRAHCARRAWRRVRRVRLARRVLNHLGWWDEGGTKAGLFVARWGLGAWEGHGGDKGLGWGLELRPYRLRAGGR